jgi:hypothetical protein
LPTPIENRRTALIVSVILGCVLGLALVGSVSGVSRVIGHRDGIPDGTGGRIITMMMTIVVSVSLVAIVAIVAIMPIVDAVIRDESRTWDGCVASWSDRCHAGGRAVDRTSAETGRGHGRRSSINLSLGRDSEKQRHRQGAEKREGG